MSTLQLLISVPLAVSAQGYASDGTPTFVLPRVDVAGLLREDAARDSLAFRYGIPLVCELGPANSGVWEEHGDELRWRLVVRSPGALSLGATFAPFELPAGGALSVSSGPGGKRLGPYTRDHRGPDGRLTLEPLGGDELLLEYTQPTSLAAGPQFTLTEVVHDYRGVLDEFREGETYELGSGFCFVDANCAEGLPYQDHKRSVVRLLINGWGCSGTLLNNTAEDGTPYVLTARHCVNGIENLNVVTYFLHEYKGCTPRPHATNGRALRGATFLAGSTRYDQALLLLHAPVPDDWVPRFAGWDRGADFHAGPGVCIGHPLGEPKKICIDTGDFPRLRDIRWWEADWELGMNHLGSSGSSLVNGAGRVFGVASRVTSDFLCDLQRTYFGRFEPFWREEELGRWLDPLGDDPETLEPFDPIAARAEAELGSGANPADLVSIRPPRIGKSWGAAVDLTRHPGATGTWLFGYEAQGFALHPLGEILVSLASPQAFLAVAGRDGDSSQHVVDIPADPQLVGVSLFVQSLVLDAGGPSRLTNAYRLFLE